MFSGEELIPRLTELYRLMDSAYSEVSNQAGFSCEGCDGVKCCTVDLILHTSVEMLYLRRGFNTLDMSRQLEILGRCRGIIKAKEDDALGDEYRNAVCALNFEGLCVLYEYRPMICRLAGITHIISRPDGTVTESGGCIRYYTENQRDRPNLKIDRTDFYRQMAAIEIEVVKAVGKRTASRTVAEALGLEYPEDTVA
jgi:hypothetical protein